MQTGYYSAAAGMVTQFNRLDTIANNLANVNTVGFKEDNDVVGDFTRMYKEARDKLPNANQTNEGASFINRTMTKSPQIVDSYTDFSLGNMQKTGNSLDLALSKEGLFFAVKTPNGVRLTRDGSFVADDEGKLVTKQGYEVLPSNYFQSQGGTVNINEEDSILTIDKNGVMSTNVPNSAKFTSGAKIMVAQPDDARLLVKEGDNLYRYDDMESIEVIENSGAVSQGFVEKVMLML